METRRLIWNAASFVLGAFALAMAALVFVPAGYGALASIGVLFSAAVFANNRSRTVAASSAAVDRTGGV
jgi:hypothetical protein